VIVSEKIKRTIISDGLLPTFSFWPNYISAFLINGTSTLFTRESIAARATVEVVLGPMNCTYTITTVTLLLPVRREG